MKLVNVRLPRPGARGKCGAGNGTTGPHRCRVATPTLAPDDSVRFLLRGGWQRQEAPYGAQVQFGRNSWACLASVITGRSLNLHDNRSPGSQEPRVE